MFEDELEKENKTSDLQLIPEDSSLHNRESEKKKIRVEDDYV